MNLSRWFNLKFRKRMLVAGALVLLTQLAFISIFMLNQEKQFRKDEAYVADTVSIGISQRNHELIVSTLASAADRWGVSRLELCVGGKQIFALPTLSSGCLAGSLQSGWFKEESAIPGFEEARMRIFRSPTESNVLVIVLILSMLFVYMLSSIQFRLVSKSLEVDLLAPLANGLIEDKPLEIFELEEIRKSIATWTESVKSVARSEGFVALASQVAHDIRSPLSAIKAILSQGGTIGEDQISIVQKAAVRINDIANELLVSNKFRFGGAPVKSFLSFGQSSAMIPEIVDLSEVVREIYEEKRTLLEPDGGVVLRLDVGSARGSKCEIVRSELSRVISNLTNNAIESLDGNGSVTMAVRGNEASVSIVILDNGKGIPAELIERLGVERVSFGKEDSRVSGSGLGLFHAREAVERMSGQILIQSQVDIGTMVTLTFANIS